MKHCALCHEPVVSGHVVHSECLELLQKTQQLDDKPLTIEELREMVGEPVYLPGFDAWALVSKNEFALLFTFPGGDKCTVMEWYEHAGPAYRRKPREWISIKTRLPDEELKQFRTKYKNEDVVEVIVAIAGAKESTMLYWNGHNFEDLDGEVYPVTHWMPMPELPEVGT